MVPGPLMAAELEIKRFLSGSGFLLLSHDPLGTWSMGVVKLHNPQNISLRTGFLTTDMG